MVCILFWMQERHNSVHSMTQHTALLNFSLLIGADRADSCPVFDRIFKFVLFVSSIESGFDPGHRVIMHCSIKKYFISPVQPGIIVESIKIKYSITWQPH